MSTIEIMVPELRDDPPRADLTLAPRGPLPTAARITIIDNGKPKTVLLLTAIADALRAQLSIGATTVYSKDAASRVIDEREAATIAASADAVLTGLGDCGACSACSLGDAIRMEALGVPSTVVISDVFTGHVAGFAAAAGLPGYHSAVVPHPVSSKDATTIARYAQIAADQVVRQLTGEREQVAAPI